MATAKTKTAASVKFTRTKNETTLHAALAACGFNHVSGTTKLAYYQPGSSPNWVAARRVLIIQMGGNPDEPIGPQLSSMYGQPRYVLAMLKAAEDGESIEMHFKLCNEVQKRLGKSPVPADAPFTADGNEFWPMVRSGMANGFPMPIVFDSTTIPKRKSKRNVAFDAVNDDEL